MVLVLMWACSSTPACPDDAVSYIDQDGDGWGASNTGLPGCIEGRVVDRGDCDDLDASLYPGADETCDGVDNDCDGESDEGLQVAIWADADGDGYAGFRTLGCPQDDQPYGDCNEASERVNPGADEVCDDGLDDDCDSFIDCADPDCACPEDCANGVDDDRDGLVDCEDGDCECLQDCASPDDTDGDGLVGCDDPDCAFIPDCSSDWALSVLGGTAHRRERRFERHWTERYGTTMSWQIDQAWGRLSVDSAQCEWWLQGAVFASHVEWGPDGDTWASTRWSDSEARWFLSDDCPVDPDDIPKLPLQQGLVFGEVLWGGDSTFIQASGWSADSGSAHTNRYRVPRLSPTGPLRIPSSAW